MCVIARSVATRQSNIMRQYWVYIMTSPRNKVLYAGVTNDLARRVTEHKQGTGSIFTRKYNVTKLVFCEQFQQINDAITTEKMIKAGSRAKKVALIESQNPNWQDLYDQEIASLRSQ